MAARKANQTSFIKGQRATNWNGFKKGIIPWNKGLTKEIAPQLSFEASEERKAKMRKIMKGKQICLGRVLSEETKNKISLAHKGMKKPWAYKIPPMKGKANPNWTGGKGTERHRLMGQKEYILWRTAVFMIDDYTCQVCGVKGSKKHLNADHIKPWALYPHLRYAIDNGRTLCIDCHKKTDTFGYKTRLLMKGVIS